MTYVIISQYGQGGHNPKSVVSTHKTEAAAKRALIYMPSDCYIVDQRDWLDTQLAQIGK